METLRASCSLLALAVLAPSASPQGGCAADAAVVSLGLATFGSAGLPELALEGVPFVGAPFEIHVRRALPGAAGLLLVGLGEQPVFLPPYGATLYPAAPSALIPFGADLSGAAQVLAAPALAPSACGLSFVAQAAVEDAGALGGFAFTKAARFLAGAPTFPPGSAPGFATSSAPAAASIRGMSLGDVNGDQVQDAVLALSEARLGYAPGKGDGTFGPALTFPSGRTMDHVAVGDLDGDQVADVVLGGTVSGAVASATLSILLGTGDGGFGAPDVLRFDTPAASPGIADLDGDGFPDLVYADADHLSTMPDGAVFTLQGHGDGTFEDPVGVQAGAWPTWVEVADLDLDGVLDLAVASRDAGGGLGTAAAFSLVRGVGDGSFAPAETMLAGGSPQSDGSDIALGDLDLDGLPDAVLGMSTLLFDGQIAVLEGGAGGAFAAQPPMPFPAPHELVLDDFNGDLAPDLLAGSLGSDGALFLGQGDGTLQAPIALPETAAGGFLASGDLDGDLDPDVVWTIDPQTVGASLNLLLD